MKRIVVASVCTLSLAWIASGQTSRKVIPITTSNAQARAHFDKGIDLMANARFEEAEKEFAEALKLDAGFVQAHSLHGRSAGNSSGWSEAIEAATQTANLPEAERLLISLGALTFQGKPAEAIQRAQRLATVASDDWRAFDELGWLMAGDLRHEEAIRAFRRVLQLRPASGATYNALGYEYLKQGNVDEAIKAFEQYARFAPKEPNAQDSLGEALLAGGRFQEAEAAFMRAMAIEPSFSLAWEGVAYTKFYRRDWTAGQAALAKAGTATRLRDRVDLARLVALASIAAGHSGDVKRIFDEADRLPGMQPGDLAFVALYRGRALINAGQPKDALASLDRAIQLVRPAGVPAGLARNVRRQALIATVRANGDLKDLAAQDEALQALNQEDASATDRAVLAVLHYARGMSAVAHDDYKKAHAEFGQCADDDATCAYLHLRAAQQAGDQTTAAALRKRLLAQYRRDPSSLLARSQLDAESAK